MAITFYYGAGSPCAWRVWLALALRCEQERHDLALHSAMPQQMSGWMQRIEGLRYLSKTWPPHWK